MSHLARNKVEGLDESKVNFEIVGKAIDLMERALLGHKTTDLISYNAVKKCKGIGFIMNGSTYGIDLYMDGGKLVQEAESMAHEYDHGGAFHREFQKAYTATAVRSYIQGAGYAVGEPAIKGKAKNKEYEYVGMGF